MRFAFYRFGTLASVTAVSYASAGLVLDQTGAPVVSGGLGDPVAQSFTPAADNIAGLDIFISGTAAFETDVTLTLFDTYDEAAGFSGELYTATVADVPRSTFAEFRFPAFALQPEREYYMLFELSDLLVIGAGVGDPYARGRVILGGGNFSTADLVFRTYQDDEFVIPAPGAAVALAGGVAMVRRRRQA